MSSTGGNRSRNETLERAQSLEITDGSTQLSQKLTPKKRKAPTSTELETSEFNKEPRLMDLSDLDTLQRGRLKSAYEWGNLEDAIYDAHHDSENDDDDETKANGSASNISLDSSMVKQVMAAADQIVKEKNQAVTKEIDDLVTNVLVVQETFKTHENEVVTKPASESINISWDSTNENIKNTITNKVDLPKSLENSIKQFIETESTTNGFHDNPKREMNDSGSSIDYKYSYKTAEHTTKSPIHFQFKSKDFTDSDSRHTVENNNLHNNGGGEHDQVKIINYGTNMPDDVKVSRYPFGSLERPKSDVLKKILAQQITTDDLSRSVTNSTSKTTIKPSESVKSNVTMIDNNYSEMQPISLTFSSGIGGQIESDLTESSQISPVFSSDLQGINSINISSMEVNVGPDAKKNNHNIENVVTINTDGTSQPSSIILIDDEKLDFTLRTLDEDAKPFNIKSVPNDEVIIIESLSSKKIIEPSNIKRNDDVKTSFITEIQVQTPKETETIDLIENTTINFNNDDINDLEAPITAASQRITPEKNQNEGEYIPRNSEIKFTTSTYESPQSLKHFDTKRHSQIDQIRSNFEKSHSSSEIPVPIRKTSIPSLQRTSPSKIPVFNSTKISSNSSNSSYSSNSSINDISMNKQNGNSPNNRISVSVTSIKNSSRNPSGK